MSDRSSGGVLEISAPAGHSGPWRYAAWFVIFLIVTTAALGLTGRGGFFAHAEVRGDTAHLIYPLVMRRLATEEMELHLGTSHGARPAIILDHDLAKMVQIGEVGPEPVHTRAVTDGVRLEFESGQGLLTVTLPLRPSQSAWFQTYAITASGERLQFSSLVLP
jgi:hypothetical protein